MVMKTNHKRLLIWTGAGLAVIAVMLPKIGTLRGNSKSTMPVSAARDQTPAVRLLVIQPVKLSDKVATIGTILSNEEVDLKSEISAKITKIYFKEGSRINKGEVLVKLNDAEQRAQLLRAQHRQTLAEQAEKRQRQLFEKQLISAEDHENAITELNIVKAEVQIIQAQIDRTDIRAPFDGVVGLRYVSEGSYITPATRIATLQDNRIVKIDFAVPEKYAGEIKSGDKITFTIQGSSRNYIGTVYAQDPKIDLATRTVNMRATSPNSDATLFAGAFANIEVDFKEKDALVVPSEALIPELKGHKVFLYKSGKAMPQSVNTGLRTDKLIEITSGVQDGDTLITSALLQLRPGMEVRPAE